jgi:hypothetical protein
VVRLRLLAAAGEVEAARTQALALRESMHRAAHNLAASQRLVMRQGAQMAFLLGTTAEIQRGVTDSDLPPELRAHLLAQLDAAKSLLPEGADPSQLVGLGQAVNRLATAVTLAGAQAEQTRVSAAATAASAEMETPSVDQLVAAAKDDSDRSSTATATHLRAILDAWRLVVAQARNPAAYPSLLADVDAVAATLDRGDRQAVGQSYEALTTAWAAYGAQRVGEAVAAALQPYCDAYATRLQRRIGFLDQELRWEDADARSVEWDLRRDRLRLALDSLSPGGSCLTSLLALDKDASGLASEIGVVEANTAGVAAAVRAEAMASFGAPVTRAPRVLVPGTDTPPFVRMVDRPLTITVGNVDQDWGAGTAVLVGFGDGTTPWHGTAETLRLAPPQHSYMPLHAMRGALPLPIELADTSRWIEHSPEQAALREWLAEHHHNLRWMEAEGNYRLDR